MTDSLLIPRAELEALLAKLENSQLDYAERVGRAQGYLDKWLMTAPKAEGPQCPNCGKSTAAIAHWPSGLCDACYSNCCCIHHAGEDEWCPVHGAKRRTVDGKPVIAVHAGDTCHLSDAAYYEQLPEHLRAATTTRKLGVIG